LSFTQNGKEGVGNVLHYEKTGGPWTLDALDDLAAYLKAWFNTHLKPQMNTATGLHRIRLRDITTQNGLIMDYNDGLPIDGTLSGSPVSNNVAFSLKKNTGFSGKGFRGRIYQGGFVEADTTGNFLSPTRANAYAAAWTEALFISGGVADYGMVLVSKFFNGSPRATGLITDVSSITYADLRVDTMRSRL